MQITGTYQIDAPREAVWDALYDTDLLASCIHICERLDWLSEDALDMKIRVKLGPAKLPFSGILTLSEIEAPSRYKLTGQGKGKAAMLGSGLARVTLDDHGACTRLHLHTEVRIGSLLARYGLEFLRDKAQSYIDDFVGKFEAAVIAKQRGEAACSNG